MRGGDSIKGKKAISELLFISVQAFYFCPNGSSYETIHIECLSSAGSFLSFSYERFCTRTRFETNAQGSSEMAYYKFA